MTQAFNIRAKVGDRYMNVGNIKPKDGKPGFSVGLTAEFVQLLKGHQTGWLNFDLLPPLEDRGDRPQQSYTPAAPVDDSAW